MSDSTYPHTEIGENYVRLTKVVFPLGVIWEVSTIPFSCFSSKSIIGYETKRFYTEEEAIEFIEEQKEKLSKK